MQCFTWKHFDPFVSYFQTSLGRIILAFSRRQLPHTEFSEFHFHTLASLFPSYIFQTRTLLQFLNSNTFSQRHVFMVSISQQFCKNKMKYSACWLLYKVQINPCRIYCDFKTDIFKNPFSLYGFSHICLTQKKYNSPFFIVHFISVVFF